MSTVFFVFVLPLFFFGCDQRHHDWSISLFFSACCITKYTTAVRYKLESFTYTTSCGLFGWRRCHRYSSPRYGSKRTISQSTACVHPCCTELAIALNQCTTVTITRHLIAAAAMRKVKAPAFVSLSCIIFIYVLCGD